MFWTWASLLLLLVVLVLLWPLLLAKLRKRDSSKERQKANLHVYNQQLTELQRLLAEGQIDQQELSDRQARLQKQLLQDASLEPEQRADNTSSLAKQLAIAVIVILPVVSFVLYGQIGKPELARGGMNSVTAKARANPEQAAANRQAESLAAEVQRRPTDAAAWLALGQTYQQAKRVPAALDAFEQANKLTGYQNADAVLALAETTILMQGGQRLAGRPTDLIEHALKLQPQSPKALWLGGLAAVEAQKLKLAIQRWRVLEQQDHPEAFRKVIARAIAVTEQKLNAPAAQETGTDDGVGVAVTVQLADELQQRFDAKTPVFVYAKAVNGPPMPLAAHRLTVGDLPKTITLGDAQSMMPTLKMSAFPEWTISARVSMSGDAIPKSGDWLAEVAVKASGGKSQIALTIAQQLP